MSGYKHASLFLRHPVFVCELHKRKKLSTVLAGQKYVYLHFFGENVISGFFFKVGVFTLHKF